MLQEQYIRVTGQVPCWSRLIWRYDSNNRYKTCEIRRNKKGVHKMQNKCVILDRLRMNISRMTFFACGQEEIATWSERFLLCLEVYSPSLHFGLIINKTPKKGPSDISNRCVIGQIIWLDQVDKRPPDKSIVIHNITSNNNLVIACTRFPLQHIL